MVPGDQPRIHVDKIWSDWGWWLAGSSIEGRIPFISMSHTRALVMYLRCFYFYFLCYCLLFWHEDTNPCLWCLALAHASKFWHHKHSSSVFFLFFCFFAYKIRWIILYLLYSRVYKKTLLYWIKKQRISWWQKSRYKIVRRIYQG